MSDAASHHEVLALRYGIFDGRTQGQNFMLPDDHAAPDPLVQRPALVAAALVGRTKLAADARQRAGRLVREPERDAMA